MVGPGCPAAGQAARLRGHVLVRRQLRATSTPTPCLGLWQRASTEVRCHKIQQSCLPAWPSASAQAQGNPHPGGLFSSTSYLQGIRHRAPLDGLAVSRAVNHDKPHSCGHCCHQHGLDHLKAGPVDVPVKGAEERGVWARPPAAWLGRSHRAYRQAGCLCSLPSPCQAVLCSALCQSCHGDLERETTGSSSSLPCS